jgi:hypothetical protein
MAQGVDASVDAVQAAGVHAVGDRRADQPGLCELRRRHDSVLPGGERGQLRIDRKAGGCPTFVRII